jgi:outer membrane protein TolC
MAGPIHLVENWWVAFDDLTLDRLIEEAIGSNQDIGIAVARVRAARAGTEGQASRVLPTRPIFPVFTNLTFGVKHAAGL